MYYIVILALLLIGFVTGWVTKKKKIEELPSGIREFNVGDWYILQPLLEKVVERTKKAVEESGKGDLDFDIWFDSQWTLPEIRTLLFCGLRDGETKENLDKLNSETAFRLYLKVMEVRNNRNFFMRAANVIMMGKSLL